MGKKVQSDFLFAQPTVFNGVARLVDIAGVYDQYNTSEEADALAISADWYVVGNDMFDSMASVIPTVPEHAD